MASDLPRETELLTAIEALAPVVRAQAMDADAHRRLSEEVASALVEHGLYRLWIPRSCGGDELALPAALRVFEAASRVDGSFGWAVTIGTGGGLFAAYMPVETAEAIFRPDDALIAGSGAPSGRAERVDGGYRAAGRWRFASGAPLARWFTANCVVHEGGSPVLDEAGQPVIRAMSFPAADVTILDTWDTAGLRATASHDFEVSDTFVPAERTFSVFDPPREPGPLYRYPFMSIAELSFAAVGLGIARHGLEAFRELAAIKRPTGSEAVLRDLPAVQLTFGEAEAQLQTARALFFETAAETWAAVEAGRSLDERAQARVRVSAVNAATSAARVVDRLYEAAGTDGVFTASELGRCHRDVHVLTQNAALARSGYRTAGEVLLRDNGGDAGLR